MDLQNKGRLIVIEGIDGSGKTTQTSLLTQWIKSINKKAIQIKFPDYQSTSSALVKMYLNGEITGGKDINPYAASTFYAADRYISYKNNWEKEYLNNNIIISDRYTTSNIVHQMVRLPKNEWQKYLEWLEDYEYKKIEIPKPNLIIYLDMPTLIAQKLIEKRYNGDTSKKDVLEADIEYMKKCRDTALFASKELNWQVIECFEDEKPLTPSKIQDKIQNTVKKFINLSE